MRCQSNQSSNFSLLSLNFITFVCFLLTLYTKCLLGIYYCTLTSLERWNLAFLSKPALWRKLAIYVSFAVYVLFLVACTISLCIEFEHWAFLIAPIFLIVACVWCCFELMNTVRKSIDDFNY